MDTLGSDGARSDATLPQPAPRHPLPANQLQELLVLQLLVQGCGGQLLLLLEPLLIHVPLREASTVCKRAQQARYLSLRSPPPLPAARSPAAGVATGLGRMARGPTS